MLDVVLAGAALVILSPVLAVTAVAVRLVLGSPVFFVQERPGLGGRSFNLVKFRTMISPATAAGRMLQDSDRLTPFGRFLRGTSLDELPELWNVLKGDMSLVGPRPLLVGYLPLYTPEQARRHEVLPGVTGWAQVNGRNALSWGEKFRLDVWYVDHVALSVDVRILGLTVASVMQRKGISPRSQEIMPEFKGETEDP